MPALLSRERVRRSRLGGYAAAVLVLSVLVPVAPAEAIPAFARQFGVKCGTCHSPVPPRLNLTGLVFKRMGFRMPDVDDNGVLTLKAKPSRSVTDDFSLLGDFRGESHRDEPTVFSIDSLMVRGGGAVGDYLSYTGEVAWSNGTFDLDNLEAQVLLGQPTTNFTSRFGRLNPMIWERADHTIGASAPLVFSTSVAVGEFGGSAIGDTRDGVEFGVNFNHFTEHSTNATFVTVGVFNRLAPGDPGMPAAPAGSGGMGSETATSSNGGLKDLLVQAVHPFGYSNTVGALWYHGHVFDVGSAGLDDQIDRVALMGNYVLPTDTDIVAAFGFGRDQPTMMDVTKIDSRGWYVEADQTVVRNTAVFFRFDRFDPDKSNLDMRTEGPTVGVTSLILDNLLFTAEYQGLRTGSDPRGRTFVVRLNVVY